MNGRSWLLKTTMSGKQEWEQIGLAVIVNRLEHISIILFVSQHLTFYIDIYNVKCQKYFQFNLALHNSKRQFFLKLYKIFLGHCNIYNWQDTFQERIKKSLELTATVTEYNPFFPLSSWPISVSLRWCVTWRWVCKY